MVYTSQRTWIASRSYYTSDISGVVSIQVEDELISQMFKVDQAGLHIDDNAAVKYEVTSLPKSTANFSRVSLSHDEGNMLNWWKLSFSTDFGADVPEPVEKMLLRIELEARSLVSNSPLSTEDLLVSGKLEPSWTFSLLPSSCLRAISQPVLEWVGPSVKQQAIKGVINLVVAPVLDARLPRLDFAMTLFHTGSAEAKYVPYLWLRWTFTVRAVWPGEVSPGLEIVQPGNQESVNALEWEVIALPGPQEL